MCRCKRRVIRERASYMDWTKNLPVSRKFTVAFGIVCGLCVVLGIFTFFTFHNIATKSVDASDKSFPSVLALADIRSAMNVLRRQDLDLLLCQTPACTSQHLAERQKALDTYQVDLKLYEP